MQFHDKMIYKFLNLFFGVFAALEVALGIDIQEGGSAAQAHGCAVLFLDGGQIAGNRATEWLLSCPGRGLEMSQP